MIEEADGWVAKDAADPPGAEAPDQVVDPARVGSRDEREDPVEAVPELDVGLLVHEVEELHRPLELLVEPRGRPSHRPEVEEDGVEVAVVERLVRLDGVLPEDEAEGRVAGSDRGGAVLAGADRARDRGEGREEAVRVGAARGEVEDLLPDRSSRGGCPLESRHRATSGAAPSRWADDHPCLPAPRPDDRSATGGPVLDSPSNFRFSPHRVKILRRTRSRAAGAPPTRPARRGPGRVKLRRRS